MPCCAFDESVDRQFSEAHATKELRRYRSRGPGVTTSHLRKGLTDAGANGTLLDIGTGIGALTFELLDAGVDSAIAVDASAANLAAASDEAVRRERAASIRFLRGDFVTLAVQLQAANTVTLDRVICCYPDYLPILSRALPLAKRHFAWSYPRDRWFVRWGVRVENAIRRWRGNPFQTVVHPADEMSGMIRDAGFTMVFRRQTASWSAEVYERRSSVQDR
jgi:SAM-dependent methyltransferase